MNPISDRARCVLGDRGKSAKDLDAKNSLFFFPPDDDVDDDEEEDDDDEDEEDAEELLALFASAAAAPLFLADSPTFPPSLSLSDPLESSLLATAEVARSPMRRTSLAVVLVAVGVVPVSLSLPEELDEDESDEESLEDIWTRKENAEPVNPVDTPRSFY